MISFIIKYSKSYFNSIYSFHSFKKIISFFKCLSFNEIPYFGLVNETDKEPIIFYTGKEAINSLNNKSKKLQALDSQLYENNNYKCNIKYILIVCS